MFSISSDYCSFVLLVYFYFFSTYCLSRRFANPLECEGGKGCFWSNKIVEKNHAFASQETVTRSSCGTDRACFSTPADCDPTTNSACLLVSTRSSSSGLDFELRGESSGYIAVALSVDTTAVSVFTFLLQTTRWSDTLLKWVLTHKDNTARVRFHTHQTHTFWVLKGQIGYCGFCEIGYTFIHIGWDAMSVLLTLTRLFVLTGRQRQNLHLR